jgi:hypothetical protein
MGRTHRRSSGANQSYTRWRPRVHEKGPFRCPSLTWSHQAAAAAAARSSHVSSAVPHCHPQAPAPPQQRRNRRSKTTATTGGNEETDRLLHLLLPPENTRMHARCRLDAKGARKFAVPQALASRRKGVREPASARGGILGNSGLTIVRPESGAQGSGRSLRVRAHLPVKIASVQVQHQGYGTATGLARRTE